MNITLQGGRAHMMLDAMTALVSLPRVVSHRLRAGPFCRVI